MSRDDSVLYSGATSASFKSPKAQEVEDKQKQAQEERKEKKLKLKPAAEPVLELIEKHKKKVKSIEEFAIEDMITEEHFKSEVMARKKFYQFLLQFEQEIKIALKDQK